MCIQSKKITIGFAHDFTEPAIELLNSGHQAEPDDRKEVPLEMSVRSPTENSAARTLYSIGLTQCCKKLSDSLMYKTLF
jgi:hypothetical protein